MLCIIQSRIRSGVGVSFSDINDAFGALSYSIITLPAMATFDCRDNSLDAKSGYFIKASVLHS